MSFAVIGSEFQSVVVVTLNVLPPSVFLLKRGQIKLRLQYRVVLECLSLFKVNLSDMYCGTSLFILLKANEHFAISHS